MRNLIFLTLFLSLAAHAQTRTVEHVDLDRYLGDWYEIGSIPQSFSKDCFCTRARYSLRNEKQISVWNSCNKKATDGTLSNAKGWANVVPNTGNAKLRVTFLWPFFGDYWIIGLDEDYRYAVISNKEGSTLWILSKTPTLSDDLLSKALAIAVSNGIDTSKFNLTTQDGCSYPE